MSRVNRISWIWLDLKKSWINTRKSVNSRKFSVFFKWFSVILSLFTFEKIKRKNKIWTVVQLRIQQVLITKLRSANTVETRQYRKASKALLVLIPLLGITYLVLLYGPNEGVGNYIFVVARAFLLSTQVIETRSLLFSIF